MSYKKKTHLTNSVLIWAMNEGWEFVTPNRTVSPSGFPFAHAPSAKAAILDDYNRAHKPEVTADDVAIGWWKESIGQKPSHCKTFPIEELFLSSARKALRHGAQLEADRRNNQG